MSEHGSAPNASVTRLLVAAKAVPPSADIVQINKSMGRMFENTFNYKFKF